MTYVFDGNTKERHPEERMTYVFDGTKKERHPESLTRNES
jgi:hypothetical protein